MDASTITGISNELQQTILNIFLWAFPALVNQDLPSKIQLIKQHLFNRDFAQAFGSEELLDAYALRWSPGRAVAYLELFTHLPFLSSFLISRIRERNSSIENHGAEYLKVVCLGGGGGAELVAWASLLHLNDSEEYFAEADPSPTKDTMDLAVKCVLIDIAGWSNVVHNLYASMTEDPPISHYAAPAARAANVPFVDSKRFAADFVQQDVLNMELGAQTAEIFEDASLVTLMFTLNELYNTSIKSTTNLLLTLTMLLRPGTLLLVVDSPGSFSTVGLGAADAKKDASSRKYPMAWLLDHTLLEAASAGSSKNASSGKEWEKLESQDSQWFRLANLKYPVRLEDMRYQVHLYRRLSPT